MKKLAIVLTAAGLVLAGSSAFAQNPEAPRTYTPLVLPIGEAAFAGQPIDSLVMYRFSEQGEWIRVPFQIDEVDTNGFYLKERDGLADADDELVVMPFSAGVRANGTFGPANVQPLRWELELTEPNDPSAKRWFYLFKITAPHSPVDGFLSYIPDAQGAGADTVIGLSYRQGHGANGWLQDVRIKQDGIFGGDLLDQQKLRIRGRADAGPFLPKIPYEANEARSIQFDSLRIFVGPVRALRTLYVSLVPLPDLIPTLTFPTNLLLQYFPHSTSASARDAAIPDSIADLAGIELVRQSLDFNASASGMRFFSDSNPGGVLIDGMPDLVTTSLPVSPDVALLVAGGSQGLVANIIEVPTLGTSQTLYYQDDLGGTAPPDGTAETGDGVAYGDMGVLIRGEKLSGQFSFDYLAYYLPASPQPYATGEQLRREIVNPLLVTVTEQINIVPVTSGPVPAEFVLLDAYPNPFALVQGEVRLAFELAAPSDARLVVYNVLGQEVARLADGKRLAAGKHTFTWSGANEHGQLVPSGVYFYALETASGARQVKKLLLLR